MSEADKTALKSKEEARVLLDPYMDWAQGEGIPIHLDFGHDLLALETAPWDRFGARGCFAHTHGRGDFVGNYVLEVEPGKKTAKIQHLYETIFYVLSGSGSTCVWLPTGETRTFEWGPKALFAIPLNCPYQIFNSSGREPTRLSCTNDAPLTINLYHSLEYVFENPFQFPQRVGQTKHFDGEGDHSAISLVNKIDLLNVWETNFVHDLTQFKLYGLESRGKGSSNVIFMMADGTMHSHSSEIPAGRYKKAHRHAAGTHVHAVDGSGYSLLWYDGDSDFVEIPWRHGVMYAPPFWMFHQHFNTSPKPARYLACSIGSARYSLLSLRRVSTSGGGERSVKQGGRQIEYEDQDPRLHRKFLDEIRKTGVESLMGDIFDEAELMQRPLDSMTGVIQTPQFAGPAI
jgi:uncharacterized RmlC-like cupin family protein